MRTASPRSIPCCKRPDQQSGNNIDCGNENRGQRIALVEPRRTIHGAIELGLARDGLAPAPGLRLVDQAGVHVRVDGHLLARQRIEREAGRHFGGSNRAMRNHQELDRDEGQEEHEADHVIAAHHELPEGLDHLAGGGGAFRAVEEDAPAGGDVQRQAEQGQQQEQGGKDAQLHRPANLHRGQKHDDRCRHRQGQQQVERRCRQRHHHHEDHADGAQGQSVFLQPFQNRRPGNRVDGYRRGAHWFPPCRRSSRRPCTSAAGPAFGATRFRTALRAWAAASLARRSRISVSTRCR